MMTVIKSCLLVVYRMQLDLLDAIANAECPVPRGPSHVANPDLEAFLDD
jgi:hypothetical protein